MNRHNRYSYFDEQQEQNNIYYIYRHNRINLLDKLDICTAAQYIKNAAAVALMQELNKQSM